MSRKKKPDERVMVFNEMPELDHFPGKKAGEEYDPKRSEVLEWIRGQSGVLEWVMDFAKRKGLISYDSGTGKWRGQRVDVLEVFRAP